MKDCMKVIFGIVAAFCFLVSAASAQTSYKMGAGDEVRLTVYGQPDLTTDGQISADGTMIIPLLGSVQLAGRTPSEAARLIADYYVSGDFLQDAHVHFLITYYRS